MYQWYQYAHNHPIHRCYKNCKSKPSILSKFVGPSCLSLIEWNRRVPCTVFTRGVCDRSTFVTSQNILRTKFFLVSCSPMTDAHHWTIDAASRRRAPKLHLFPSKGSFNACTSTIVLSFSMTSFKVVPYMSHLVFYMQQTQTLKDSCILELSIITIWPNQMTIKWYIHSYHMIIE